MKRLALSFAVAAAAAALAVLSGCASLAEPTHPSTGRKVAVRQIVNKSQQFGLEDALVGAVRDEFLRDGRYPLVPENEAEAVVAVTITHYILTPLAYDTTLAPITYKLRIDVDVQLLDRATNKELWKEENLEGSLTYPNQTLAGGQTEAGAQATIWTILAPMIVSRVADGFSAVPAAPVQPPPKPADAGVK
jgi:uncharacterized protein YceK